jgi:hypothetical protein
MVMTLRLFYGPRRSASVFDAPGATGVAGLPPKLVRLSNAVAARAPRDRD